MKQIKKLLALALGSVLAVSLAACGGEETPLPPDDTTEPAVESKEAYARICYDNLPDDGLAIDEADTKVAVENATSITGYSYDEELREYTKVANPDTIATYENGVFTAVGKGIVTFKIGELTSRIEVVPAYVTNPGNQYKSEAANPSEILSEKYLGHTHDPSFIEVNENGKPVYYLFSTGWNEHPTVSIDGVEYKTYGNAIHRSDNLIDWKFMGRTFDLEAHDTEFVGSDAYNWLYDGNISGYGPEDASWWAPDIVPCPSGGYWLYTCVVDGSENDPSNNKVEGMLIGGQKYARACILLYHSDTLEAGSFKAVKGPDGKQAVLMQSSIQRGETVADVNGIDPQIIYTPDEKMYMAYGSFGSGNYILELDPETGLRKDGKCWQTHEEIRQYVADIQDDYGTLTSDSIGWTHDYYGTNISKANMEAPVIARHDNVKVFDETTALDANGEPTGVEGKTYYYSMHSYDGLEDNYQMYGGRSESVTGVYKSAGGEGIIRNSSYGYPANPSEYTQGNKYMGAFTWHNKSDGNKEIDIILPGHNDLFTTNTGVNLAAYITRTTSLNSSVSFLSQVHQYYLNSKGDIVINPNRYSDEMFRTVTKEELMKYTEGGKFKMVFTSNQYDTVDNKAKNVSVDVILSEDGKIMSGTSELGTWQMYGKCYIKLEFAEAQANGEKVYYGVVSPAWLGDQNKSGFTITALGYTNPQRSMSIFLNNYSTLSGSGLVG